MNKCATESELEQKWSELAASAPSAVWAFFDWARDNGGEEWNSHLLPPSGVRERLESIVLVFYETSTPIDEYGGAPEFDDLTVWNDLMDLRHGRGRWTKDQPSHGEAQSVRKSTD